MKIWLPPLALARCLMLSTLFLSTLQEEAAGPEAGNRGGPSPELDNEMFMPLNPKNPLLGIDFATTEVPGELTTKDPLDPFWHMGTPAKGHKRYKDGIAFYLHTQKKPGGVRLEGNVQSLKKAGWKPEWPVKVLIAGYLQNSFKFMLKDLLRAYHFVKAKANIVVIDYTEYSDGVYTEALNHVEYVAKVSAKFLAFLDDAGMVKSLNSVHLIGHSLGAQVAGVIGYQLKQKGKVIGRITGLDPARPGYKHAARAQRLDKSDAAFVDVIHTNMPDVSDPNKFSFGIGRASGHADFYPNGGAHQPGCTVFGEDAFGLCSHIKAVAYYERSIRSKTLYPSCPCSSWHKFVSNRCWCDDSKFIMGEHCSRKLRGSYYLRT